MAKHFKSRKKLQKKCIIECILLFVVTFFLIKFCIYSLTDMHPSSYLEIESIGKEFLGRFQDKFFNHPTQLLNYQEIPKQKLHFVTNLNTNLEEEEPQENKKRIYIYSTHDTEKYSDGKSILDASSELKKQLEKKNVIVDVEGSSISEFIRANNYHYNQSYVASRYFLEEALRHQTYDLIIDLHRDATSKKASTYTFNNQSYARVLFVVGKDQENYQKNYQLAYSLHEKINASMNGLSRGVLLQGGEGYNGIYNQDLKDNIILLELGGNLNTYEEVKNTIEVLVPIIGDYLNE